MPVGGVGKDEGDIEVNSFVVAEGRFVPFSSVFESRLMLVLTIFFSAPSKFARPSPLKSTHIIYHQPDPLERISHPLYVYQIQRLK